VSDLVVDGAGLQSLVDTLHGSADLLRQVTSALSAAGTAGLGRHDLDRAADHCASDLGYGIGVLNKAADTVAKQLEESIRVYAESDADLADLVHKAMTPS